MKAPDEIAHIYSAYTRKKTILFLFFLVLLAAVALLALCVGSYRLMPLQIIDALLGRSDEAASIVIWNIRAPRIVAAIIAGWGLALAGVVIQCILNNPLGSPFTLGISHGAAFGAAFAIVVLGEDAVRGSGDNAGAIANMAANSIYFVTLFAFLGAILATVVIIVLARIRKMAAESIILSGVALSSLFVSGTILIQYFAEDVEVASIVFWTFGDVGRASWSEILLMAAATVPATVWFFMHRWSFNALSAGEDAATGLGVNVERIRIWGMLGAAFLSALIVSFLGVIGFLGLVAPHMARRIVGEDHRFLVPHACVLGGLLLLASDTIGRTILESGALPVGVITSFMGAPVFLYLLLRGTRR